MIKRQSFLYDANLTVNHCCFVLKASYWKRKSVLDTYELKPKVDVLWVLVDTLIKLFCYFQDIFLFSWCWCFCKIELQKRLACYHFFLTGKLFESYIFIAFIVEIPIFTDLIFVVDNILLVYYLIQVPDQLFSLPMIYFVKTYNLLEAKYLKVYFGNLWYREISLSIGPYWNNLGSGNRIISTLRVPSPSFKFS